MVVNKGDGESHTIGFSPVLALPQPQDFLDSTGLDIKREERSIIKKKEGNGQPLINV